MTGQDVEFIIPTKEFTSCSVHIPSDGCNRDGGWAWVVVVDVYKSKSKYGTRSYVLEASVHKKIALGRMIYFRLHSLITIGL